MLKVRGSQGFVPVVLLAMIRAFDASIFSDEFAAGTPMTLKAASSRKLLYALNAQLPLGSVASSLIACAGAAMTAVPATTNPVAMTRCQNRDCSRSLGMART